MEELCDATPTQPDPLGNTQTATECGPEYSILTAVCVQFGDQHCKRRSRKTRLSSVTEIVDEAECAGVAGDVDHISRP